MINSTIQSYQNEEGLNSLRKIWQNMICDSPSTSFFHYFQWYQSITASILKNTSPIFFFTLFHDNNAVAIFPLQYKKISIAGIICNALEIPDHDHIDLSDFIYSPDTDPDDCVAALVTFLKKQKHIHWDILRLPHLLSNSPTFQALQNMPHYLLTVEKTGTSDVISCREPYNELQKKFSKNFRGNLRKARNKLTRQKNVQTRTLHDEKDLLQGFQDFLHVEASGWKGKNGTGTAIQLHPELVTFYGQLIKNFSKTGECEINLLTVDNKCIAGQFCLAVHDILYILKIGYDPEYARLAPGNMLLEHTITRLAANSQINCLSLVTGTKWHADWKPESQQVIRCSIFNHTFKGRAAHSLLKTKNTAKMAYKKIKK